MRDYFVVAIHGGTSRRWHGFVYDLHVVFFVSESAIVVGADN